MKGKNKRLNDKIRKWIVILIIAVTIILSAVNISVKTNKISLSSATTMQSDLNALVVNNYSHYNFRTGYINFTQGNSGITFGYFLRPFNGVNPVYAGPVNYSQPDAPSSLAIIVIYQISGGSSSNSSIVPFTLNSVTLNSPQGFSGKIETRNNVDFNSLVVEINPPGPIIQSFTASKVLGSYPGHHNFYLNFTLTIYNTFGPYKFPSQSKNVHLEYNNTIVV